MAKRRPSGDGMVRKRSDGRWEGRLVVGHKDDGRPIFRSVFGKTQKELLEKLHQQKTLYQDVELTEDSRMTLGEWLDKWLAEYISLRIRPSTLNGYKNYVNNYIKPVLGNKVISKIESADVQKIYTKLKKEGRINCHPELGHSLSDTTIRSIHGVLHGAMEVARQEGLIARNPTVGAVLPKDTPKSK